MRLLPVAALALTLTACTSPITEWAFQLTGEEQPASQVRALTHLAVQALTRPPLRLQPEMPIAHTGVNPFGINTFLQQEVEPAKREQQMRLLAEAGLVWLRQEFPWADIEISAKGNFEDCRNIQVYGGCIPAWRKYDQIVELAERYDLNLIVRLSSPPDWSRADGAARGAFAPPDNLADFADYAAAVATRYAGRVRYYQVWNEPNIYPEWGDQPANPEAYTDLLCQTYRRLKAIDPSIVVLSGVLAPTNQLGDINPATTQAAELNDFIYLQRMYQAGAGACFDVLTVQGYGLWSGPTDQRNRPLVVNYARNQFIRDIMVRNGDAHKALWIAEMNWNAVPEGIAPTFGRVTEEEQARYLPLAFERQQAEWPWVGVNMVWFFKRATEDEKNQAWYYFRLVDPDFTLRPAYEALSAYTRQTPRVHPGWFQEDHWALTYTGAWRLSTDPLFTLGAAQQGDPGAQVSFHFSGTSLRLDTVHCPTCGQITVEVAGRTHTVDLYAAAPRKTQVLLAHSLPPGSHPVTLTATTGTLFVDGLIVRRTPNASPVLAVVLALGLLVWLNHAKRQPN